MSEVTLSCLRRRSGGRRRGRLGVRVRKFESPSHNSYCKATYDLPEAQRNVDMRLPGRGNSTPHGARPVYQIITVIKWIRWDSDRMRWGSDSVSFCRVCGWCLRRRSGSRRRGRLGAGGASMTRASCCRVERPANNRKHFLNFHVENENLMTRFQS